MKFSLVLLVVALAACGKNAGKENGSCYGAGKCDKDLQCVGDTCAPHKNSANTLEQVEKFVDASCACTDMACVAAAKSETNMDAMERLGLDAPAKASALKKKAGACVESLENTLGKEIHELLGTNHKIVEANQYLKKMSDAARTYYSTPAVALPTGNGSYAFGPKQFPASVGPTPPSAPAARMVEDVRHAEQTGTIRFGRPSILPCEIPTTTRTGSQAERAMARKATRPLPTAT